MTEPDRSDPRAAGTDQPRSNEGAGLAAPRPLVSSALAGIQHGFLTRQGGVSTGPFASLNCALSGADDPRAVAANRRRACVSVGLDPARLVAAWQVHSPDVVRVREPWGDGHRPRADALVTDRPGIVLSVVTADCAPVLFADEAAGVVGAAHAGWRGAAAGVLEACLEAMVALGARPERTHCAIGPSIRQASYQVGPEMRDEVLGFEPAAERFFELEGSGAKFRFDLQGSCRARLERAGLAVVDDLGLDTYADAARFFSYRRTTHAGGGPLGHQVSLIGLGAR